MRTRWTTICRVQRLNLRSRIDDGIQVVMVTTCNLGHGNPTKEHWWLIWTIISEWERRIMIRRYKTKPTKKKLKNNTAIRLINHSINDCPPQKKRNDSKQITTNYYYTTRNKRSPIVSKTIDHETNTETSKQLWLWTFISHQTMPL